MTGRLKHTDKSKYLYLFHDLYKTFAASSPHLCAFWKSNTDIYTKLGNENHKEYYLNRNSTHEVTIMPHRSVLCQNQPVQVCHHVSHLPFQWSCTSNLTQINDLRSLFQEGPLTLHAEKADGICSNPQLDHPEKKPLLIYPLACNITHTRNQLSPFVSFA